MKENDNLYEMLGSHDPAHIDRTTYDKVLKLLESMNDQFGSLC
ncbi:hypothetical protein [Spirosoma telluris]